jgi:transposase
MATSQLVDDGLWELVYRCELWRRGVKPSIARRGTEHGSGFGRWRWVVERTFAWLYNYRRLRIRWEREPVVLMVFLTPACALISAGDTLEGFETGPMSRRRSRYRRERRPSR